VATLHTISACNTSRSDYSTVQCYLDWRHATFTPADTPSRTFALRNEVFSQRQATLLALLSKVKEGFPSIWSAHDLANVWDRYFGLSREQRQELLESPELQIWVKLAARTCSNESTGELTRRCRQLSRLLDSYPKSPAPVVSNTCISVRRFDVDPLIKEVTPPTYSFPKPADALDREKNTHYPLAFFCEVATAAVGRVAETWPEAHADLCQFIKVIVHVPDATFRSCSASRYTGVVFLSASDTSLLEMEESLVHEYGHQVLYHVMELDPILLKQEKSQFKLPWSGSKRDLYGYFHAFYIYVLLASYYAKVRERKPKEMAFAKKRLREINAGLRRATRDFENPSLFTKKGKHLFEGLKSHIKRLPTA